MVKAHLVVEVGGLLVGVQPVPRLGLLPVAREEYNLGFRVVGRMIGFSPVSILAPAISQSGLSTLSRQRARQTARQAGRLAGRQAGRHACRQTGRQTRM